MQKNQFPHNVVNFSPVTLQEATHVRLKLSLPRVNSIKFVVLTESGLKLRRFRKCMRVSHEKLSSFKMAGEQQLHSFTSQEDLLQLLITLKIMAMLFNQLIKRGHNWRLFQFTT